MVKPLMALAPLVWLPAAAAKNGPVGNDPGIGSAGVSRGLQALFTGVILIVLVPLLVCALRKILEHVRARKEKSFVEELTLEAGKREQAGEFVSAALAYEKLKNLERAAELYKKGRDFMKAAEAYELMGQTDKISEMYEMAGDLKRAADSRMYYRDFSGAARTYNQLGDKRMAAEALMRSGNKLGAARAYREAKDYLRASALLKEAGMYREAAEMYAISLAGSAAGKANLDKFYEYAALLETAGDPAKAAEVFITVSEVNPHYRDVRQRIEALDAREGRSEPDVTPEAAGEPLQGITPENTPEGEITLRSLIRAGGIEPRHSFRIWVQVLKVLDRTQREGRLPQILTPECIVVDSRNNVTFRENTSKDFAYIAPEVVAGSPPDTVSSVYSMGVILYEMLTGSLDTLGIKRPGEVGGNVPDWLEELTLKCCERKREARYQGLDEIFSVLADLKKRMQE